LRGASGRGRKRCATPGEEHLMSRCARDHPFSGVRGRLILRTSDLRGSWEVRWAAPGGMMPLLRGQQGGRIPRVGRREQGSSPPTPALGLPPPQERLAADPPDSGGSLPGLVPGRPHPRATAAHLRPDSRGHRAGAGGGRAPEARPSWSWRSPSGSSSPTCCCPSWVSGPCRPQSSWCWRWVWPCS
jgi:hypothetical protein